ncbi:MAG: ATP-binding protein [Candidatus Cloacimonas sp.]|nr:ATP-binding protein [Candidatus Cloacimonas sp.]
MDKNSLNRTLIIAHMLLMLVLGLLLLLKSPVWLVLLSMAVLVAIFLAFISKSLHKQYNKISPVAQQIALGDHSKRIPNLELDEFNHLGKDLNQMLGKLDNTIHHLSIHREELRLVLSSIDDVLWSQNLDGRLVWANQAFMNLFSAYDPKNKQFYWEVIREPILVEKIKNAELTAEKMLVEIQVGDSCYMLSGNRNDAAKRMIFIMQDIAPIRMAEQMKKDFIVNLAHELRTPLTAIKGFTDAMQDKPLANNFRYLQIIQNHTNRLIHLISDLEQLIRLERTSSLETREINLDTFFNNVQMILKPHVAEKDLELIVELDAKLPRLQCDPFKLEQVFINLVQNSLRYTHSGAISIRSKALDNELLFVVSDTGIGIDANHLPRIFERFYVADPSRNKSQSGTGLGLAIVKHIVLLHHGRIEVHSELGKGTSFNIYLPTKQLSGYW